MDLITLALAKKYSDSKGGYTEPTKEIVNLALTEGASYSVPAAGNELTAGETYTVVTENGSFSAVCKEYNSIFYLGNIALCKIGDDTGESYVVIVGDFDGSIEWVAVDQNGGSYIKVTTAETIHPIDPKYLPGVCLPVVEITSIPEAGTTFDTDVAKALTNAIGMPVVLVIDVDGTAISEVAVYSRDDSSYNFIAGASGLHIYSKDGENWVNING